MSPYEKVLADFYDRLDRELRGAIEAGCDLAVKFGPDPRNGPADPFTYSARFVRVPPGESFVFSDGAPYTLYRASQVPRGHA